MKKTTVIAIMAIASLLFVFSLVVASRPSIAQGGIIVPYMRILPLQRDLWSLTAADTIPADAADWHGNNGGLFTVSRDSLGRLPVLTNIHAGSGQVNVSRADVSTRSISDFWTSSDTFQANNLGVVISPGTYFIQRSDNRGMGERKQLLLSGYWAPL